jgi:hypothetical protein
MSTTDRAIEIAMNPRDGDTPASLCIRWMRVFLQDGPRPARDGLAAARDLGFDDCDIRAAQRRVGVRLVRAAGRLDLQGRYAPGPWTWTMRAAGRQGRAQVDERTLARINATARAIERSR